ncbi:SDR family oxidoreductase [Streptomyces sp. APSN-46.1]|nr:SDR family oxidoreductase [Streptomyces sp. APSN-46.1]
MGRAVAERLAADGVTVVLTYANDEKAARRTVERIGENGGRAHALRAELGRHGDAAALWETYDALGLGGVDILVNNAGIGLPAPLGSVSEEGFDRVFAVNVRAPFFLVQEGLGLGRLRDGGRIVNVSSGAARIAMPDGIAYGPTKAALDILTLNLAKVLGPRGITVNSVAPGIVDTDVNAGWLRDNAEAQAYAASLAALGRVGNPEDVADVADVADIVGFLASDAARRVTGRVVDATGGAGL